MYFFQKGSFFMEMLDIYDAAGNCIGQAPRKECHGNPALLHHTSHVVVFHPEEPALLLQLRKKDRLIQPGKWVISVPKKGSAKNVKSTTQLHSSHMLAK